MGRYVTPRGVVLTLGDVAARAVGYKPADEPKANTSEKKPAAKRSAAKKSDDK